MTGDCENKTDNPSKAQRKRDMAELRKLAERLADLSQDQLDQIKDQIIRDSIEAIRKIKKGNAHKRQVQYTAKLLSRIDSTDIRQLVDSLDASTAAYVNRFHRLETWRESLILGDSKTLSEIFTEHPECDRQKLRQLTRAAVKERGNNERGPQHKKLFQFLKHLPS